jgi:nitronate monooxygenase
MWPKTALIERLALEHAILQAPMASISKADLVAAVSNAGGLGSLGSAVMTAAQISEQVAAIRAGTQRSFALNFFVHQPPRLDPRVADSMRARLAAYRTELGVQEAEPATLVDPPAFDRTMLELVLKLRPNAVSFHFGLPETQVMAALRAAGIFVMGSATSVSEAKLLERGGVDAVIAQGVEAGGHRGTFAVPYAQGELGLMALLPQVVDAVTVPVVAAGGIADGRGIAAALVLGAAGVQIGTAFLGSPEAAIDPVYRETLQAARATNTRITSVLTGRPARAIVTRFIEEMAEQEGQTLEFPLQRLLTAPLARASVAQHNPEFHAMWAGQAAAMLRPMPAGELLETLVEETRRALRR